MQCLLLKHETLSLDTQHLYVTPGDSGRNTGGGMTGQTDIPGAPTSLTVW